MGTSIAIKLVNIEGDFITGFYRHYDGGVNVMHEVIARFNTVSIDGMGDVVNGFVNEYYDATAHSDRRRVYELHSEKSLTEWGTTNTLVIKEADMLTVGGVLFSWNGSEFVDAEGAMTKVVKELTSNVKYAKAEWPTGVAHLQKELTKAEQVKEGIAAIKIMHALETV